SGAAHWSMTNSTGTFKINNTSAANALGTAGTDVVVITSANNFGIGASPNASYKLDVSGAARVTGALAVGGTAGLAGVTATSVTFGGVSISDSWGLYINGGDTNHPTRVVQSLLVGSGSYAGATDYGTGNIKCSG